MRKLTPVLLMGTYFLLSASLGATLYNGASDPNVAIAAMLGCLGVCVAFHVFVGQRLVEMRVTRDIEQVREAHRLMVDAIENGPANVPGQTFLPFEMYVPENI